MKKHLKSVLKAMFHRLGLDIIRIKNSPKQTLCGLRSLPIQTVIDVGANTGQFARQISRIFPQAKIYCFEPLPEPFKALESWALEQDERVKLFNVAIGDSEGTAEIFFHTKQPKVWSLDRPADRGNRAGCLQALRSCPECEKKGVRLQRQVPKSR